MFDAASKVENLRFRDLLRQAKIGAFRHNVDLAKKGRDRAKELVHVRTGALQRTIRMDSNEHLGEAYVIAGNATVDYAASLEFGTKNHPPYQYMRPSAKDVARAARNSRFILYAG